MRSDFNSPEKVLVAGKAGMNDDPHHGHLDIGQFVVYWQNEYFIQDLGRAGYDEKYFDEARFDYPEASSIGHNVLYVNGEKQISGKYYKQPYDYSVGGKVLEFKTSDKHQRTRHRSPAWHRYLRYRRIHISAYDNLLQNQRSNSSYRLSLQ